jgi:hypothetical protein
VQPEPPQILHHRRHEFRSAPPGIQVFIPQNQRAAGRFRPLLRRPKSPRVTEVQKPGRRGSNPSAIHFRKECKMQTAE